MRTKENIPAFPSPLIPAPSSASAKLSASSVSKNPKPTASTFGPSTNFFPLPVDISSFQTIFPIDFNIRCSYSIFEIPLLPFAIQHSHSIFVIPFLPTFPISPNTYINQPSPQGGISRAGYFSSFQSSVAFFFKPSLFLS